MGKNIGKNIIMGIHLYRNKNNQNPNMTSDNQKRKIVALVKSLKKIYVLLFRIHIPDSIVKNNKHIYKIRY